MANSDLTEIFKIIDQNPDLYLMLRHCPYEILKHWEIKDYSAGQIICCQGKKYDYLYIILEGNAEIYYMAENGRKYSQAINRAGECVGDFEIFEQKNYICYVEAFTNLKLLQIRRDIFTKWLELDRNFSVCITKSLCNRFYKFAAKAGEDTLYSLKARLCSHLLSCSRQVSKKTVNIEIKFNKDELSDRFAVTSRSINRVLHLLKDKNIITFKENSIIINDLNKLTDELENSRYD